jgi:hypothetical protein
VRTTWLKYINSTQFLKISTMIIDYTKVSKNTRVIALLKERELIEREIKAIDKDALVKYELEVLRLT